MRKLLPLLILFFVAACRKTEQHPNRLNQVDREFLNATYIAGKTEIQAGHVALNRASNGMVRQYANEAIQYYTLMQDQLRSVAETVGFELSDTATVHLNAISDLSGYDFDTSYIRNSFHQHARLMDQYRMLTNEGNHTYLKHYFFNQSFDEVKHFFYRADSIYRAL